MAWFPCNLGGNSSSGDNELYYEKGTLVSINGTKEYTLSNFKEIINLLVTSADNITDIESNYPAMIGINENGKFSKVIFISGGYIPTRGGGITSINGNKFNYKYDASRNFAYLAIGRK